MELADLEFGILGKMGDLAVAVAVLEHHRAGGPSSLPRTAASLLGYPAHVVRQRPPDVERPDRWLAAGRQDEGALVGHPVSEDRLVGHINPALRLGIVYPVAPRTRHQLFLDRVPLKDRLFFLCNRWFRIYCPGGRGGTFPAPHPVDGLPNGLDLDTECVGDSLVCQFRPGGAQGDGRRGGHGLGPAIAAAPRLPDFRFRRHPVDAFGALPPGGVPERDPEIVSGYGARA